MPPLKRTPAPAGLDAARERAAIEAGLPWIGDAVHDPLAGMDGVVTDVRRSGEYVIRALGAREWIAEDPKKLEVRQTRAERAAPGAPRWP